MPDTTLPALAAMHRLKSSSRRQLLRMGAATLAASAVGWTATSAQAATASFPSKPLRLVIPFTPGSSIDNVARYLSAKLSERLGQPGVVENRPGGNGLIAVQDVLGAPGDGHTIFIGSTSTLATSAVIFREPGFDPVRDFTPLSVLFRGPVGFIVPGNSPFNTFEEFVEGAPGKPGQLTFASASPTYHLMLEILCLNLGIKALHVPYKGSSEVTAAVASGTVDFGMPDLASTRPLIESGKLKALVVGSEERNFLMPELRTAHEAGANGYSAYTWVAAVAKAGIPQEARDILVQHIADILSLPETREFYMRSGLEVPPTGPEYYSRQQATEIENMRQAVAATNMPLL